MKGLASTSRPRAAIDEAVPAGLGADVEAEAEAEAEAITGLPPTLRRDLFGSDEDWIEAQTRLDLDHYRRTSDETGGAFQAMDDDGGRWDDGADWDDPLGAGSVPGPAGESGGGPAPFRGDAAIGGTIGYAYAGDDPVNRTDSAGPAADDGLARARGTLSALRAGIRSEIAAANQPEAGSRTRSGAGITRVAVLRNQLGALDARTLDSFARMRVAAPSAAVGAGIADAMRGAPPETVYTARGSNGSVTYVQAARRSRTSDSGHATTETENLLATGHRHDSTAGNEYPGIGDPGNTLRLGVPTIYSYGENSNAIGWNGSRFTLTNIRGTLPSYQSAPDWIRATFEPW